MIEKVVAFSLSCAVCGKTGPFLERSTHGARRAARESGWKQGICPPCQIKRGATCGWRPRLWDGEVPVVGKSYSNPKMTYGRRCGKPAVVLHRGPFGILGPFHCKEHEEQVHEAETHAMVG